MNIIAANLYVVQYYVDIYIPQGPMIIVGNESIRGDIPTLQLS